MENQIPQTSSLPSSPPNDKKNVGTSVFEVKQAEFDEMKNRLSKLEELFANLQAQTISKAEHEARIAEIEGRYDLGKLIQALKVIEMCEKEKAEFQQQIAQIKEVKETTDESIHKLQTNAQEMQIQIFDLEKEIEKLHGLLKCNINDFLVDGQIDYGKLDGKVLVVKKLEQKYGGKWYADGKRIRFEDGNFMISTKELITSSRKGEKPYAHRITIS